MKATGSTNGTLKGALIKAGVGLVVVVLSYYWMTLQGHERFKVATEIYIQQAMKERADFREEARRERAEIKDELKELKRLILRRNRQE